MISNEGDTISAIAEVLVDEVERLRESGMLPRCFSEAELAIHENASSQTIAGMLAVKRLLCTLAEPDCESEKPWQERDITLVHTADGAPEIGECEFKSWSFAQGLAFHISVTHTKQRALGLVALQRNLI